MKSFLRCFSLFFLILFFCLSSTGCYHDNLIAYPVAENETGQSESGDDTSSYADTAEEPEVPTLSISTLSGVTHSTKLTVYLLIDESSSMTYSSYGYDMNDYERLVENIEELVNPLLENTILSDDRTLEWTVHLSTTDPRYGILDTVTWDQEDNDTLLKTILLAMPGDSVYEKGFETALTLLEENPPDSDTLFIFYSDEDDQSDTYSTLMYNTAISNYLDSIGSPFEVTETAMVPTSSTDDCSGTWEVGHRYMEAAETDLSICSPETWSNAWNYVPNMIPRFLSTWELPEVPYNPDDIVVYINGVPVSTWTWDAEANAVILSDEPDVNSTILITWTTLD
nr:hypothetical protein 73 [bacterium]